MASIFDLYRNVFGGGSQPQPAAPQQQSYDVGSDTIPLSLDRTPVNDPYTGTALQQLMGKLGDIGTAVPGLVERAQLGGMSALGMRQADGDIYRSKLPVAPGIEALGDAANFATGGLQSSLFPRGGAYRQAAGYAADRVPSVVSDLLADQTGAIRAYHASPHSFDRFDLSKIGTGEGAQAYGHGLYFAENEGVARGYREALAGKAPLREYGGQPLETSNDWYSLIDKTAPEDWRLAKIIDAAGKQGGVRSALDTFEPHTRNASDGPLWAAAIERFKEGVGPAAKGHMYEVDINAEPRQFLDWDKPLGQQGEYLQNALAVPKGRMPTGSQVTELIRLGKERGVPYTQLPEYQALREQWESATASAKFGYNIDPNAPGSSFYERLIQNMGTPEKASKALRLNDVPGIRYLDQGSRGGGTGTSNYAVFDDKRIQILRKYGLLPPVAGATGAGLLGSGEEPY